MAKSKMGAGETAAHAPHKHTAYDGGINWEWIYYDSEQKALEVIEWIRGGANMKFNCGGRVDMQGPVETTLGTLWKIHAHRDNDRRVELGQKGSFRIEDILK